VKLQGIIFDLDGTLGNTIPMCIAAFQAVFERFLGRRYTDEEITALFGPSEEGMIRRLVPEHWQHCLQAYLEAYTSGHKSCPEPFPGIETALRVLKERGVALAVVTGKGDASAMISLEYLGLSSYFDQVETGSVKGAIKPQALRKVLARWHKAPAQVAYVGDTAYDMRAATEVGLIGLGAAWAETAMVSELEATAPTAIFRSTDAFLTWIDKHIASTV
jgi:pyrophosphatase PpaX